MSYEKKMLSVYREAFSQLSDEFSKCGSFDDAAMAFSRIHEDLVRSEEEISKGEVRAKLEGRGPTAQLAHRLGLKKSPSAGSLFNRLSPKECLDREKALGLVREFFSTELTTLDEGGPINLNVGELRELPSSGPDDLEEGLYRVSNLDYWNPRDDLVIVIRAYRPAQGFILITIPKAGPRGEKPAIRVRKLTFVDYEKEWVTHTHIELASYRTVRSGLIRTIRSKLGHYLNPVSKEKVIELFDDKKPARKEEDRIFEFHFQTYKVALDWITIGVIDPFYRLRVYHNSQETEWNRLSTVRQNQLFESIARQLQK